MPWVPAVHEVRRKQSAGCARRVPTARKQRVGRMLWPRGQSVTFSPGPRGAAPRAAVPPPPGSGPARIRRQRSALAPWPTRQRCRPLTRAASQAGPPVMWQGSINTARRLVACAVHVPTESRRMHLKAPHKPHLLLGGCARHLGVDPEAQLGKLALRRGGEEELGKVVGRLLHRRRPRLQHGVHHADGALDAHVEARHHVRQRLVPVHGVGQHHLVLVRQEHVTNLRRDASMPALGSPQHRAGAAAPLSVTKRPSLRAASSPFACKRRPRPPARPWAAPPRWQTRRARSRAPAGC